MKRIILPCILCFCLLCLLLAGCKTPVGRISSESFVPSELPSEPETEPFQGSTVEGETGSSTRPGIGGPVKTVVNTEGDYTCDGRTVHYSYQMPFVDLASNYATGCNNEIELRFGNAIRDAETAMENYEPLDLLSVSYTSDIQGNVLTVRVTGKTADGNETFAVYSLNSITGAKATLEEFLTVIQIPKTEFTKRLKDAATERFQDLVGTSYQDTDVIYTTALTQTLSATTNPGLLPMYFTQDGRVIVYYTIYLPGGGSSLEELIVY